MPKQAGRLFVLKKDNITIGGGRTVGMTINGSPVDVQDQGDEGFVTYLPDILTGRSIEITIEGYEEDQTLRDIAVASGAESHFLNDISLLFPNAGTISGDFVLTAYSETGAYEDGQTFSATLSSDGAWTFSQ